MLEKETPFRVWVNRMWVEYKDELSDLGLSPECDTPADYFGRYRWWLKSRYKLEKMAEKEYTPINTPNNSNTII